MSKSIESLNRLLAGNARFVAGESAPSQDYQSRRAELADGQSPFAIILGCSDSRAPAELIFDQGLGDLFVIRVAGNVAAPTQVGSVEFAASKFGSPLVVVLGHTHCGAIAATVNAVQNPVDNDSGDSIGSIVECIAPAIEHLVTEDQQARSGNLLEAATRANIETCVDQLSQQSPLLKELIDSEKLVIIGAQYDIETGKVDFFYPEPVSVTGG